ncbi:gp127 (endogenous virus) [Lactococcus phage KSY1]|uniref:Gp127 n=1 Tax=Lactococcus phage KSY1 TaxID=2913972 RepID=A6MAJ2_9CAUD|nr:gp127 [Lactococcus phage KSY1]ABG21670.1 gp127 [Lactococcus phage KSY1]
MFEQIMVNKDEYERLVADNRYMKRVLEDTTDVPRRLRETTDFGVGFQPPINALDQVVAEAQKALTLVK